MSQGLAPQDSYRLPKHVVPEHYDLKIWTDLEDLAFSGVVEVRYAPPLNQRAWVIISTNMLDIACGLVKILPRSSLTPSLSS